jgi:hypothetical protein
LLSVGVRVLEAQTAARTGANLRNGHFHGRRDNRDNECTFGKKYDKQKLGADTESIEKMHRTRSNYLAGSHFQSRIDFNRGIASGLLSDELRR